MESCMSFSHVTSNDGLTLLIPSAATGTVLACAVLGVSIVTAPSALVALVHVAVDALLGDDVVSVFPVAAPTELALRLPRLTSVTPAAVVVAFGCGSGRQDVQFG